MNKFKKILCIAISILMAFSLASCNSNEDKIDSIEDITGDISDLGQQISEMAEENSNVKVGKYEVPSEDDFKWIDVGDGVAITGYSGTITAVEIPANISGKAVLEIGSEAFSMTNVVGVRIPDSITTISDKAFFYCVTLVEFETGKGTKVIGNNVFEGCSALSRVKLNEGLESIGSASFCWTSSLNAINFPKTLTSIGYGAFCLSGIEDITVPGSVEIIEEDVFQECKNLKSVVIENGVKAIMNDAFDNCINLQKVEIPDSVTTIEVRGFTGCTSLTINASSGSEAENYAKNFGFNFKAF